VLDKRFIPKFLQYMEFDSNASRNTIKAYKSDLDKFLTYVLDSGSADVTSAQILGYVSLLRNDKCSDNTVKRRLASIRRFLRFLEEYGFSDGAVFPKIGLNFKTQARLPRVMPLNDVRRLFTILTCSDQPSGFRRFKRIRDGVMIRILFYTGMRVGEMVGLDRDDIETSTGTVLVHGKGGKDRVLYLRNNRLTSALDEYVELRDKSQPRCVALFTNRFGDRLTSRSVEATFQDCIRRAAIRGRYTPHSLRHTMATALLEGGTNLRALQEILGHSSVLSTQIYTHVAPQQVEEALSRLGRLELTAV
jgi:integrase/recombinase XerD